MKSNILKQISSLKGEVRSMKDEFVNIKDVIIKRLQDKNALLRSRFSKLEDKVTSLESNHQLIKLSNIEKGITYIIITVISGIPDYVADDQLEDAVISIMFKMVILKDVTRFENLTKKFPAKKTIVRFINRKFCKKALVNRKNLININSEMKYNFSRNNKTFINKNLTRENESIAFCDRKLKRNGKIHACFTRDEIVFIRKTDKLKAFKVHHMNDLYDAFPKFDFFDHDGPELYHDTSPNISGQSSY